MIDDKSKKKIAELFRYGLVGTSTTLINLATYHLLLFFIDYRIANLIALIASKTYGYFANKTIVFRSKTDTFRSWLIEVAKFVAARGTTAVVDYFGLILAVEVLGFDKIISKYVLQIIVIVMNYLLGKYVVFNNPEKEPVMENLDVQEYNTGNIDKYQTKNSLKRRMVERFQRKLIGIIRQELNNETDKGLKILDAGCGEGFFSALLHGEFPRSCIIGCDGAEEALEVARTIAPGVDFEKANLYELPYADQEFDLVVCSEVLEHLNDPAKALTELERVGRKILVTVPHEPWFRLGNLLALHNVSRLGDPIDHINHWSFGGFKRFILSRGSRKNNTFDRSFPWSIYLGY